MRARRLAVAFVISIAALAVAPSAFAEPTPDQIAGARAAATEGNKAFAEKRYKDSLDLFQRAESLLHAPTHVLMIARSNVELGHLVAAREAYRSITHETLAPTAPQGFRSAQDAANKELPILEPRVPSILVKLSDPAAKDVVVTMDGTAMPAALVGLAKPVDPGDHKLSARGEVVAADEQTVHVDEGGHIEVVLALHPAPNLGGNGEDKGPKQGPIVVEPADPTLSIVGYTALGVGGAAVIAGGVFLGLGFAKRGEADDAYEACGAENCVRGSQGQKTTDALDADANTPLTAGTIALVAGGAIAVTGLVLVLVAPGDEASVTDAAVMPFVGPGMAGVRGRF